MRPKQCEYSSRKFACCHNLDANHACIRVQMIEKVLFPTFTWKTPNRYNRRSSSDFGNLGFLDLGLKQFFFNFTTGIFTCEGK